MSFFPRTLKSLLKEKAELEAQLDAKSASLAALGPITVEISQKELTPLTLPLVHLERRIRDKTPWKQLVARRDELRKTLESSSPEDANTFYLRHDLASLDLYLEISSSRRKPVTALQLAVVFGIPALLLALEYFIAH